MNDSLQVVLLEDRPADAELIVHELTRAGFDPQWVRVETEKEYREILDSRIDLILADYSLPQFDAMRALRILQDRGLDIPFIVVTGAYEEHGVECMKEGAADCLVKDRLTRLGPAVRQALVERYVRQKKRSAEEALQESEERCRSIIDNALDAVVTIDATGAVIGWTKQAEAMFGWRHEEVVEQPLASTIIPPEHRQAYWQGLRRFLETGAGPLLNRRIEITALHRDGREFPVELSVTPITVGNTFNFSAFIRDITERRQAEEQRRESAAALASANESLREANEELRRRNAELDEFTFVASHELQEPLRKMISFSALLAKDLGRELPGPVAKDLDFITDAARRMQALVQDLLSLSRTGRAAMKRERVPLNACVDRALLALAVRVEETGAEISRDELPTMIADPTLLTQLYQNLIGNALKFVRAGQRPQIRLTCEELSGRRVLGVRDNGIGIKPEYREQIFAPFKRLHARGEYEGSGIGLTICRKAVERHGGDLWVESQPGEGSHFRFTLGQSPETRTWEPVMASAPSSSLRRMIPAIKN